MAQWIWNLLDSTLTAKGSSLGCEFEFSCAIEGSIYGSIDKMAQCWCLDGYLKEPYENVYGMGTQP